MGLMAEFQKNKKENPDHGTVEKGNYQVLGSMPGGSKIAQQQASADLEKEVARDLESLKKIKSKKEKESVKSQVLVPKYQPFVDGLLASATAHPFLGLFLVWLFDAGMFDEGIKVAQFCLDHDIPLPEKIKRDIPTFVADAICDWAENQYDDDLSASPYFDDAYELVMAHDLHDQVKAKMLRLHGLYALKHAEYAIAVETLTAALDYGAKVKTKLAEAEKKRAEMQGADQQKQSDSSDVSTADDANQKSGESS